MFVLVNLQGGIRRSFSMSPCHRERSVAISSRCRRLCRADQSGQRDCHVATLLAMTTERPWRRPQVLFNVPLPSRAQPSLRAQPFHSAIASAAFPPVIASEARQSRCRYTVFAPPGIRPRQHQGLSIVADRRRYLTKFGSSSSARILGAAVGGKANPDNRKALTPKPALLTNKNNQFQNDSRQMIIRSARANRSFTANR